MKPPVAKKESVTLTLHGDTRVDPYYWMRERDNPAVIEHLEAENAYREEVMKETKPFEEKLFREITGRIKQKDESVPYRENGYYYYSRYEEGGEYPVHCRKKGSLKAGEEIMVNVNSMAEGYEYFDLRGVNVSPDNRLMAFGTDTISRRIYTLRIKDLETGKTLPDEIPFTTGSSAWATDNRTLYYTRKDEVTLRSNAICRHLLGTPVEEDVVVFEESDDAFSTYVFTSKSREYIIIGSYSTLSDEFRFLPAGATEGEFRVIQPRIRGLEYSISHFRDHFYIRTNLDAPNFRIMKAPVENPGLEQWTEMIPHRRDVFLEGMDVFNDYLVVEERREGLSRLRIMPWKDREEHDVKMDEEVYAAGISVNPEMDSQWLRFYYSSLTTPHSVFDYHMGTRERKLLKQTEVLGGTFDPSEYVTRRTYATADDGTRIPISLVHRKELERNGMNPTLIYGYGSYGHTIEPSFGSHRLSLLDRGFVYAIAHIRGGQINGRSWYENGKLLNKMNTFTDFNRCAEHLVKENYTSPGHLYAMGGSAGGLLMAVVINLRPDLYRGVIAAVPFVDVVTTMLDESIPLTTMEYDEWGNPNDEEYYRYILGYSPYDNVKVQDYPNLLVTTGLHDSQVQYWEPAKWVARLRDMKTGNNMLLLYCDLDTGHGGASGRFEHFRETAMEYAFLLRLAGKTDEK